MLGLLAACNLANLEGKIGKYNHGMVLWALEIDAENFDTSQLDTRYATYAAAPGILPVDVPELARSNTPVKVSDVSTSIYEDYFTTEDGRTIILYADAVFDKDTYALAYFLERVRFKSSYFHESYRIHIAPSAGDGNSYLINSDVPIVHVGLGEAVYIGTFGVRLTHEEQGRVLDISRSYHVSRDDAESIMRATQLKPERLRIVNVFEGHNEALRRYQRPVSWKEFE